MNFETSIFHTTTKIIQIKAKNHIEAGHMKRTQNVMIIKPVNKIHIS